MHLLRTAFLATMLWSRAVSGHGLAWGGESVSTPGRLDAQSAKFGVYWPPQNPVVAEGQKTKTRTRALLDGTMTLQVQTQSATGWEVSIQIGLSRAVDEAGREFWNSRLAFPEYDWMSSVRVWDADHRWLWPNLAYLLRLHGRERVDRYGGVDPGKGVDNDFAAVLIRKYDASGERESRETSAGPLVSAEWRAVGVMAVDRQTLVHTARSDAFNLHLGTPGDPSSGKARVWLIYADFLGVPPPKDWPQEPEYAGGILAYFEVDWAMDAAGHPQVRIQQLVPRRGTGFDWARWALQTLASPDAHSTAKLSDRVSPAPERSAPGAEAPAGSEDPRARRGGSAKESPPKGLR